MKTEADRLAPLAGVLTSAGCPSPESARALLALRAPGVSWVNEVLNSGQVDEARFLESLAAFLAMPFQPIDHQKVERGAMALIPSRTVFLFGVLPLTASATSLTVACFDPLNAAAIHCVRHAAGRPVHWVVAPRSQILRAIKTLYGVGAETFEEILKTASGFEDFEGAEDATDLDADNPEASVIKFVNQVIREAIEEHATDIHIEPLENDIRIRYRLDGILHEVAVPPQLRVLQAAIITRLKVMAKMDIAERRLPQDGRIPLMSSTGPIDVRVSTIPTVCGESISLRLLNRSEEQRFDLKRLDLSPEDETLVRTLLAQPNGIVLVTGPTGCGKSTTLYSCLSSINSVERRIITVEEPVEYRLPGVMQIDVKPDIDLTFASALRSILRQDPNVIMVGEIRDFETAEIAIRAAMTGHLVFSTLHTNDAVSGITRLLDMGVEPFLLASVVRVFVAQRLVRRVCPACAEDAEYRPEYLREIGFPAVIRPRFRRGRGCDQCRNSGYQGRQAIFEFCVINDPLRIAIVGRQPASAIKTAAINAGMRTLRTDGWRRVLKGETTVEEVVRVTQADETLAETD